MAGARLELHRHFATGAHGLGRPADVEGMQLAVVGPSQQEATTELLRFGEAGIGQAEIVHAVQARAAGLGPAFHVGREVGHPLGRGDDLRVGVEDVAEDEVHHLG